MKAVWASSSDSGIYYRYKTLVAPPPEPSASPVIPPTPVPSALCPVSDNTPVNATMVGGILVYLSSCPDVVSESASIFYGTLSSNINTVISTHFPQSPATRKDIWLGGSVFSYLRITGSYDADEPIVLLSQFMLVLDNANISALASIVNPTNTQHTIHFSPPLAIVVAWSVVHSGVIGVGGPKINRISCSALASMGNCIENSYHGPPGFLMKDSVDVTLEGVTVDYCGQGNGAVYLSGTGTSHVSNCIVSNAQCRGVWLITTTSSFVHDTEVYGSTKFGIDLDAYAGDRTMVYRNKVHDNGYQGVFIEQGATMSVIAYNKLGPGTEREKSLPS